MTRLIRNNSGMALILTILVISLIVSLTLQFNTSMRSDLYAAANIRDGIMLGYIAKSGFNYARAVLLLDAKEGKVDSFHEAWADEGTFSAGSAAMFEKDRFEVKISDHSGRIPINRLVDENGKYNASQKDRLRLFLKSPEFGLDPEDVDNIIVDAIKDWIDADDEVTKFGAEDAYYQGLEEPYRCGNKPLESLEELLLVRGITEELFYGINEKPGLCDYLTVYGDGKININTASLLVLKALSDQIDQEMAEDMVKYREDEKNDLSQPTWYRQVLGDVTLADNLLTTSSTYFEIASEGKKDSMVKKVTGMVERTGGELNILSLKID